LVIDGRDVSVPSGTLLVDAAKRAGIEVPVFCYHPKLEPVGMCRMCLVEIGRPERDRATGDWARDADGKPRVRFGGKLETACTTPVGEGWEVRVASEPARQGRKEIVEFLLTSHPLDCPICDKGGECPLQELTMDHGAGKSRFLFQDKIDLAKHVPLGDLIFLDRERCIQCARCTRFQDEIVGEAVIGFELRGRELQIVTYSDPGFDSYFSGNTTDICPVGALTTADFRFEARPWELRSAASVCPHCAVGCNVTLQVRRQPHADGRMTVQRVMPRQNEAVNEIWMCDKGRFGHHFAASPERILRPRVRDGDALVETSWDQALARAAEGLRAAGGDVFGLAGGRASTEDLFQFRRLVETLGGHAALFESMGGGEFVEQFGAGPGTNLARLGRGDAVLIVATDLHEEAPIWWLRLKQAAERGASVITLGGRALPQDRFAQVGLHVPYSDILSTAGRLAEAAQGGSSPPVDGAMELARAAEILSGSNNLLIFFGCEGLSHTDSEDLARVCGAWVRRSGRIGRPQNGLIAVWPHANSQGAFAVGLRTSPEDLSARLRAKAVYLMAADPAEDPNLAASLDSAGFVVVQELFLTESARRADVVFPAQAFSEREGSYLNGERRLQRTYPSVPPRPEARQDWQILSDVGAQLGVELEGRSAGSLLSQIASEIPVFRGVDYQALSGTEDQWPPVGGRDLYFGGTAFANAQGVGVPLPLHTGEAEVASSSRSTVEAAPPGIWLVPIHRLYDRATTLLPSAVLHPRMVSAEVRLNPEDARNLGIAAGSEIELRSNGRSARARAVADEATPRGVALAPHSVGLPFSEPTRIEIHRAGEA
jgi:NADH-quinone oxidoreductase subunit G